MALLLGYIEKRWGYLVNWKKKSKKEISEIQDKRNEEITQEPIILLHFWQFCPQRPAARTSANGVVLLLTLLL